jgi:hypothetical protein
MIWNWTTRVIMSQAHPDQMMSKLNTACFVIRMIQTIMSPETLKMFYFTYIHSIVSYGIMGKSTI